VTRVLGVIGSPRNGGNTDVLVSAALEAARSAGADVEPLRLAALDIGECDGCHACWKGKPCPQHDDMTAVYDTIARNDAILFGTPVYWYGPTALMKLFLDRFVYFNCPDHRPMVAGKRAGLVVPLEERNPATAELVVAMFERSLAYLEMPLVGQVVAPGVTERGEVRTCDDAMNAARDLGRRLAAARH
jgi:multimeric flavodoxin WrbA